MIQFIGGAIDCNFIDCNTIVGGSKSVHCYTMIDCNKLMDGNTTIDCCRKIRCKKFLDGNKSLVGNNDDDGSTAPKVHLVRPRQNVSVVSWPCHTGEPLHSLGVVYFSGVAFVHGEDPHRFIVAARDNLPAGGRVVERRHGSHMVDVNVDRTF